MDVSTLMGYREASILRSSHKNLEKEKSLFTFVYQTKRLLLDIARQLMKFDQQPAHLCSMTHPVANRPAMMMMGMCCC